MEHIYFYDVPVYRLPREQYYNARDDFVENALCPADTPQSELVRGMAIRDPNRFAAWRSHLEQSYGGCWEFNEIIGYIRLHFLGTQVRGEYFGLSKKRIVRTRKKLFEHKSWKLAPEVSIRAPKGNEEIIAAVHEYIEDCRRELPRRYIDASILEAVAPYIDWAGLLHANNS